MKLNGDVNTTLKYNVEKYWKSHPTSPLMFLSLSLSLSLSPFMGVQINERPPQKKKIKSNLSTTNMITVMFTNIEQSIHMQKKQENSYAERQRMNNSIIMLEWK